MPSSELNKENPAWKDEREAGKQYNPVDVGPILSKRQLGNDSERIAAELRNEAIRCGIVELYIKMALTGREFFLDDNQMPVAGEILPATIRMGMMQTIITKTMPTPAPIQARVEKADDDSAGHWGKLAAESAQEAKDKSDKTGESDE